MIYFPQIVAPYLRHLSGLAGELDAVAADAIARLCAGDTQAAYDALITPGAGETARAHVQAALGFIAYQRYDAATAMQALEHAVRLAPQDAYHRALLATCQLGTQHFELAIANFRAALRDMPSLHIAHSLLWSALAGAGKLDAAVAALKHTLAEHARLAPSVAPATRQVDVEETTLCIVDCANHALAARALVHSMSACRFDAVKWLTDRAVTVPGVQTVPIAPIRSLSDYSRFMVKKLLHHVDTEYVLTIQWDGYVVNPAAWTPEFLLFDYIGARWDAGSHAPPHHNVGNGGFSMRSRSLLEALQDPAIDSWHPEDDAICRTHRTYLEDHHGIVFADAEFADRFSFEHLAPDATPFGFHGLTNLARFVDLPGFATMDYFFDGA